MSENIKVMLTDFENDIYFSGGYVTNDLIEKRINDTRSAILSAFDAQAERIGELQRGLLDAIQALRGNDLTVSASRVAVILGEPPEDKAQDAR